MARPEVSHFLRNLGGGIGFTCVGVLIGGGAFLLLDGLQPPRADAPQNVLSLRAPYYATCREAFQDGRANIRRGEQGYRVGLDVDGDGLACEPYVPLRR